MATFSIDQYLEDISAPVLIFNGREYEGIHLSIEQYAPYAQRMMDLGEKQSKDDLTDDDKVVIAGEYTKLRDEFLRKVFPHRWKYIFVGDPIRKMKGMPALDDAFGCFFRAAAESLNPTPTAK